MSIHDSALADTELADAVEDVICCACIRAPLYAADLVQQAGMTSSSIQLRLQICDMDAAVCSLAICS